MYNYFQLEAKRISTFNTPRTHTSDADADDDEFHFSLLYHELILSHFRFDELANNYRHACIRVGGCALSLLISIFRICMKIHLSATQCLLDVKPYISVGSFNNVCHTLKWNGSHFIEYKFDFLRRKIEYFWKWRPSLRHSLLYLTFLIKF